MWTRGLAFLVLLCISLFFQAWAQTSSAWSPPCAGRSKCRQPIECFTCTEAEYWRHPSLDIGGYPASAKCQGVLSQCLYCWKQHEVITAQDGFQSAFQYKSCVPWPVTDSGSNALALYSANYCTKTDYERTTGTCTSGWCTKTVTECQCNVQRCNVAVRLGVHNLTTALLSALFVSLLVKKCFVTH
mmetsp:Transcript_28751/g.65165  ORF Transcript_28751/g.65165 Transcript_28751/m.65165 type:complete len:186 (-) Transcript_28751:685-1242(-)